MNDDTGFYIGPPSNPDKYRLVAKLGAGGEGVVWTAEQKLSEQGASMVAVKILQGSLSGKDEQAWDRHVDLLRAVRHPGLVQVLEGFTGLDWHRRGDRPADTSRYVVMDWVEGTNLRDIVAENPEKPLSELLRPLHTIADALDDMHSGRKTRQPVAHGDVKPANIMVVSDRSAVSAVLVDLGLMRISDGTAIAGGTAPYAAPELFREGKPISPETDRFAFAATVAHVVLGEHAPASPLMGPDLDETEAMLKEHPRSRHRPELRRRLMQALRAAPQDRPQSLGAWLSSLEESLSQPITVVPTEKPPPPHPPEPNPPEPPEEPPGNDDKKRRSRLIMLIAAAVAVVLCATGASFVWKNRTGDNTPGRPGTTALAACANPAEQLSIVSSQEKAGLLADLATGYGSRTAEGTCVSVAVRPGNSGKLAKQLADGWQESDGDRPDVWSPASQTWLDLSRWRSTNKTLPADAPSLFSTPVVIGMPKPMAEAMGWPDAAIGWKDLAGIAADPKGWGRYQHPEWGKFQLGKTNPQYSSAGLAATIGAYFAYTGRSNELTRADVDDPKAQAFVRGLEKSVVHYGDTTLTFLANLRRADDREQALSYVSAVTIEESSLIAYNQGFTCGAKSQERGCERKPAPKTPLVAIYPQEGTQQSAHPYVKMAGLSAGKSAVADDFLRYVRSPAAQPKIAELGFRTYDGKATTLVTREHGALPDIEVNQLGRPQPDVTDRLLTVWPRLRKPANVIVLVDTSKSMADPVAGTGRTKLTLLQQARGALSTGFSDDDRVGLWKFADHLDGPRDYVPLAPSAAMGTTKGGLTQRQRIDRDIAALSADGGTGLYNTIAAASGTIRDDWDPDAINAVVVLTDGRNETNRGITDLSDLIGQVRSTERPVRVFSIAYGSTADPEDQDGQTALEKISNETQAARYDATRATDIADALIAVISNF